MTRIPSLDTQLVRMKSLLQAMCDRVLAGFRVVIAQTELQQFNTAELIKTVVLDTEVDNLEKEVDDAILMIFATQQPLAYELRLVYACAKVTHQIERIGDAVESLARQLAGRNVVAHHAVVTEMMHETRNIFERVYKATFEGDLSQITEIHVLDDKIDLLHRELYQIAKSMLLKENSPMAIAGECEGQVSAALQLINISTKLEKIADLCCNWAEQIDFAEYGVARRTLKKRKHRIVFVDNEFGVVATLAATFLQDKLDGLFDIGVVTKSAKIKTADFDFSLIVEEKMLNQQIFPIANLQSVSWNRAVILICLGNSQLTNLEDELVPYKIVRLCWPEITLNLNDEGIWHSALKKELSPVICSNFANDLALKISEVSLILARTKSDTETK